MAEHLIPITISVDDETIERKATEYASKLVADEVIKATHGHDWRGELKQNDYEPILKIVENKVETVINENKDLIIQGAIKTLAEKLSRTKKCKELLEQITND